MGIDSMRVGGGRCPPFLVGGLLVACLMLICNWWTLSSENIELVRQIDELNEQLKISAEERDQCVTLRGNLEKRLKHAEKEAEALHVRREQQQIELRKKGEDLEESLNLCKTDLDNLHKVDDTKSATLETLRVEKDIFNTKLYERLDENKKLQEEVEQLKDELSKIKLTCNKPERDPELIQQPNERRKQASKNIKEQTNPDATETEYPDNSKQGNLESTDANMVESERDAQMKAPSNDINN